MKKILFGTMLIAVFLGGTAFARAAVLSVVPDAPGSPVVSQPFVMDVLVDTGGADVNAIQGEINYPTSLFHLQDIQDGSSPITFWLALPKETSPGVIDFGGIIPGGFSGTSTLLSLVLDPIVQGQGTISVSSGTVLKNDGEGTALSVALQGMNISVASSSVSTSLPIPASSVSPNPFTPEISQDPAVFGGKYFLVFSTTDKGTGIDHYEVLEVPPGSAPVSGWQVATSPYLLSDQSLSSDIYVRAVDHAGNFIVVKLPARNSGPLAILPCQIFPRFMAISFSPCRPWKNLPLLIGGIFVIAFIICIFWCRRRRNKK